MSTLPDRASKSTGKLPREGGQPRGFFASAVTVYLVALAIRLVGGWWLGQFSHPPTWEYEQIADSLLAGRGFVLDYLGTPYRAFTLPLYPVFCAVVYWLTQHDHAVVLVLQCLISAGACLQVRAIGRVMSHEPWVAVWSGWLVALHPGLVVFASRLHALTLEVGMFLAVLWAWLKIMQRPGWGMAVVTGCSSGLALLTRGTIIPFVALAMGWFMWRAPLPRGEAVKRLAVIVLIAGLMVAPWLRRNARYFHRFPLMLTETGELLWRGNHALASGSGYLPDGREVLAAAPESFRQRLARLDEFGQARFFSQEARRFIREHPLGFLALYVRKVVYFWWFSPQTGLLYPRRYLLGYQLFYIPLLMLALVGLRASRRLLTDARLALPLLFLVSVCAVQSLYYVDGRHRWTVEPVLLLFSALGGARLLRRMPRRRSAMRPLLVAGIGGSG